MSTDMRGRPIGGILAALNRRYRKLRRYHCVDFYRGVLHEFPYLGRKAIGWGENTIRIELMNGNILKLSPRMLLEDAGSRPFDLPILERGTRFECSVTASVTEYFEFGPPRVYTGGRSLYYFIQPRADVTILEREFYDFWKELKSSGYTFCCPGVRQVGRYEGRICLLDPWAVQKDFY